MANPWVWVEKGGMTTLECERSEDGGIYLSAISYGYREDSHTVIALSRSKAIDFARWLLRTTAMDTGTAAKTGVEIKLSHNTQLNHISDDYDLTSNDTRRGD